MSDNSNPKGTGTTELTDADLDAWDTDVSEDTEETLEGRDDEENSDEVEAKSDDAEDGEDDEEGRGEDDDGEEGKTDDDPEYDIGDGIMVKLSELKQGYQRTADYTRKTQALAAEQKQLAATTAMFTQHAQTIEQRKQQLEETFELAIDIMAKQLPPEPDINLAMTDPQAYVQQKAIHEAGLARIQATMNAHQQSRQKLAQAEAENDKQLMIAEGQKVHAAFPQLKDAKKAEAFWHGAYETGKSLGLTTQELDGIRDARIIIGLGRLAGYMAREKAGAAKVKENREPSAMKQQMRPASAVAPRRPVNGQNDKSLRTFRETGSVAAAERAWANVDIDKL
jgi:hypothetical protein